MINKLRFAAAAAISLAIVLAASRSIAQELVLTVDRVTGASSIDNQSGAGVEIDNYAVRSASGQLDPFLWNPLQTSGIAGPGWEAANVSVNQVAELNLTDSFVVTPGASLNLGSPVAPTPLFGTEDVTFEFFPVSGGQGAARVNYVGRRNNLILTVNPFTGAASIKNEADVTVPLDNYAIRSSTGSLDVAGWNSFAASGAAGPGWEEENPSFNQVAELNINNSTDLTTGTVFPLGNPYNNAGYRDLVFEFTPVGGAELVQGIVDYVGAPMPGQTVRIEDVSIADLSSQLGGGFNRPAEFMLDGSGVNVGAGSHTIVPDGFMWLTAGNGFGSGTDTDPFVVFDLGQPRDVTSMRIWNYNEDLPNRPELLGRGVDEFEVLVSENVDGPFNSLGIFSLDVAPGLDDEDFAEMFPLAGAAGIQFIKFDILSNHNGISYPTDLTDPDFAFAGLSEVQFFGPAILPGQPGDTDGNGTVDIDDLNNVRNNFGIFGQPDGTLPGDAFPFDGRVDIDDLNAVRNNFGVVPAAVPEPASGWLLVAGLLPVWFGIRRPMTGFSEIENKI